MAYEEAPVIVCVCLYEGERGKGEGVRLWRGGVCVREREGGKGNEGKKGVHVCVLAELEAGG